MIGAVGGMTSNSAAEYTPMFSHKTVAPHDSAVLSLDAQAKLLEQQGLSVGEIASQLGLTTNIVQTDLGIAIASSQTKFALA